MNKKDMPKAFKVLREDQLYKQYAEDFARDVNVQYPSKYFEIFARSRNLFDLKTGPYQKVNNNSRYNDLQYWYSTINGEVQEKLTNVYYHYLNIKTLEDRTEYHCNRIVQRLSQLKLENSLTLAFNFRKYACEYEAFILQLRSCLEHFIHSLAYYFNFKTTKPDSLMNKLNELSEKDSVANIIKNNFEKKLPQLEAIISKPRKEANGCDRDKIAHIGQIFLNPVNIIFNPAGTTQILPVGRYDGTKGFENHPNLSFTAESMMNSVYELIYESYHALFNPST